MHNLITNPSIIHLLSSGPFSEEAKKAYWRIWYQKQIRGRLTTKTLSNAIEKEQALDHLKCVKANWGQIAGNTYFIMVDVPGILVHQTHEYVNITLSILKCWRIIMVIICAKHDVYENENYSRVLVGLGCITILRIICWMESTTHTNLIQWCGFFFSLQRIISTKCTNRHVNGSSIYTVGNLLVSVALGATPLWGPTSGPPLWCVHPLKWKIPFVWPGNWTPCRLTSSLDMRLRGFFIIDFP